MTRFKRLMRFLVIAMFALAGLMLTAPPQAQARNCTKHAKKVCKKAKRSKRKACVRIVKKHCKNARKRSKRRVRRTVRRGNSKARCIRSRCRGKRGRSLIRCIRRCR